MESMTKYSVSGYLRSNYYKQLKEKDRPVPFNFEVEADSPAKAAATARQVALLSKGKIAAVREITEVQTLPKKYGSLVEAHGIDWDAPWHTQDIVAFDVETTGLDPHEDRLVEIGWATYNADKKAFDQPESILVNEGKRIPKQSEKIHGISNEDIADAPSVDECHEELRSVFQGSILVAQNRGFDVSFLQNSLNRSSAEWTIGPSVCTKVLSESMGVRCNSSLSGLTEHFGVNLENAHRAGDDAKACGDVFLELARRNESLRPPCSAFELVHYFDHSDWPNDP